MPMYTLLERVNIKDMLKTFLLGVAILSLSKNLISNGMKMVTKHKRPITLAFGKINLCGSYPFTTLIHGVIHHYT